jgi:DNA-binding NarL/FixJ family response regulator
MILTVLIVDDDELVLRAMKRVLTREGHDVHAAAHFEQAVRLVAALQTIHVALLDLLMPDGSAEGVHDVVRGMHPQTQTAIVSAFLNDLDEERRRGLEARDVVLVHKPLPAARLVQLVVELWRRQKMRRGAALFVETYGLSPCEAEVLQLVLEGVDRATALAERLHRSPNTVKNQLQSSYEKTDTHSCTQLAAAVFRFACQTLGLDHPDRDPGQGLQRTRTQAGHQEETLGHVIRTLDDLGVKWSLVGAHAVSAYTRPRPTEDIDLVVDARRLQQVLAALEEAFGALNTVDVGAAVRVTELSVNLIRSDNHPLFREALAQGEVRQGVRVPPAELLVALKFLAAVSPWRRPAERKQDAADLIGIYHAAGSELDIDCVLGHASRVYPGAEKKLAEVFARIERDRGEDVFL